MTTSPFEPHEEHDQEVAAADPGRGAPEQAPGLGVENEEPDEVPERGAEEGEPIEPPD
jgi:hypothetical protein